jgi:hypothetical protein
MLLGLLRLIVYSDHLDSTPGPSSGLDGEEEQREHAARR